MLIMSFGRSKTTVFLIPFLISSLFGHGVFSTMVLCIGGNGHVAVESAHHLPHSYHQGLSHYSTDSDQPISFGPANSTQSACLDVPLIPEAPGQRNLSGRHAVSENNTREYSPSAFLLNTCDVRIYGNNPSQLLILKTPIRASLQSTVLLI
jgi:hypothetical protein